jgi:PAS domain S-box-containing protein
VKIPRERLARRVVLAYVALGVVWIVAAELVGLLRSDVPPTLGELLEADTLMDAGFVVGSGAVLYLLLRRGLRALAAAEADFAMLLEQASDGILVADAGLRLVAANRCAAELTGYSTAELLRLRVSDLLDPDDLALRPIRLADLATGQPVRNVRRFRRRDGATFDAEVSARRLPDGRYQAIVRDITDRRRMEAALREREELFHAVFENAMDALFVLDDQGRFLDANAAGLELLGIARDALQGRSLQEFLLARPRDGAGQGWEVLVDTGHLAGDSSVQRPDGSRRSVAFRVLHGILPGRHLALLRDVERERGLEEQLRLSQRMESLGRLAGGIAHDFNNLLTAILGHTEMLIEDVSRESPLRQELIEVRAAALRATALTRQLLAFSRRQVLSPRVLELGTVVRDLEPMLRRVIGEDVVLAIACEPALTVRADQSQLEQVIVNLAVNARDAMPSGGQLSIRAEREHVAASEPGPGDALLSGEYAVLTVSDTGHGIAEDVLPHIFEPFFTTKERGRGSGLGLSTVYGIVSQSGGVIRVESRAGRGATFRIYLPCVSAPAEPARPELGRAAASGTETVLLVEDEEAVRSLARRGLESYGYRVLAAPGGAAALELARKHPGNIDVVVSDVVMPGMSGPQLVDALRRYRPRVSVVYISGYAEDALGQQSPAARGATFLAKPFTAEDLAGAVRSALRRSA